jgi:hypothetical protein
MYGSVSHCYITKCWSYRIAGGKQPKEDLKLWHWVLLYKWGGWIDPFSNVGAMETRWPPILRLPSYHAILLWYNPQISLLYH